MSGPPPENLMDWPKGELAKEVARLRTIMHEHSERIHDPARSGGDAVHADDDPHGRGNTVLDTREAVLLDYNEVILVDREPGSGVPPEMALIMEGRVSMRRERVKQMYLFGTDGAAALISQIVGLAGRAGGRFADDFKTDLDRRMEELP